MKYMEGFTGQELFELAWEKPVLAQLEVTSNCNQACLFCFNACQPAAASPDLSLEQWKMVIDRLGCLGVHRLDFTGGEPLMYEYFLELLHWARNRGFTVAINTNGTYPLAGVVPFVDEIVVSVHGLNSIHDEIVKKKGSFALVERNLAGIVGSDVRISINMFLVKLNYHQILEVWNYFQSQYPIATFAPAIAIKSLFGKRFKEQALVMTEELLADYIQKLCQIPEEHLGLKHGFQSIFINNSEHYITSPLLLPNCAAGKYKLVVASDGNVYPCNFFRGQEFYCGNLLADDPHELWQHGKGFQYFRKLVLEERIPDKCKRCLKKDRCFSGCQVWSTGYQEGGFYYVRDMRCELGSAFIGD